ncbi:MAG: DoxX family protein [Bacteroidales bacterium]|nr:DoxX family protein [Bacteroidales bacterium]MBS3775431.1 DoxX family protein [Bacteroidales bacterium]
MFDTSNNALHVALLILRIGFGVIFVLHGWPKIIGGVDTWSGLGGAMGVVGLDFAPAFWGFMAALAEFAGGLLLVFGFLVRPAAALLLITMLVAVLMHSAQGDALSNILHPLKGLVVFIVLLYSGAGKYSLDRRFAK